MAISSKHQNHKQKRVCQKSEQTWKSNNPIGKAPLSNWAVSCTIWSNLHSTFHNFDDAALYPAGPQWMACSDSEVLNPKFGYLPEYTRHLQFFCIGSSPSYSWLSPNSQRSFTGNRVNSRQTVRSLQFESAFASVPLSQWQVKWLYTLFER